MTTENASKGPDKILYTAVATADGGRDGKVVTDDGKIDLAVAVPKSMGGSGNGTNPEQLFASGYAACFGSALAFVARSKKLATGSVKLRAEVGIGPKGAGFGLAVKLVATIPDLDRETAMGLLLAAHEVCPYSNATRGNIPVTLELA
jgi:lipoyl-dependent peroxiredoxin